MKILLDTNVFLDVLLARRDHLAASRHVLDWCESVSGSGVIAWHTLSNLAFIGGKLSNKVKTNRMLDRILAVFEVAPVSTRLALGARGLRFTDFEDALQAVCAVSAGADLIVTRNVHDFRKSPVQAVSPSEFLKRLSE